LRKEKTMRHRRAFLQQCAAATAGMFVAWSGFADAGFTPAPIGGAPG